MTPDRFIEPTTHYWQKLHDHLPEADVQPPFRLAFPVRLPDGRWLRLPIRLRDGDEDRAVASFIANHASFAVLDVLSALMAEQLRGLEVEAVVGLPTLGLALAPLVARRLGHDRIVPFGTSRKYWYDERWSETVHSITTSAPRRLYVDPHLVPLLRDRRVLVVDDTISSGTTAVAALSILDKIGARAAACAFAMSQGAIWRDRLDAAQRSLVRYLFQTPHLVRDEGLGGWTAEQPIRGSRDGRRDRRFPAAD
jgi:adenine/guanine phosphoribosyltransferase-like PRPP-binding protein